MTDASPGRRIALIIAWLLAIPGFVMVALVLFLFSGVPQLAGCQFNILSASLVHCRASHFGMLIEPIARLGSMAAISLPFGGAVPVLYSIGFAIWRLIRRRQATR